MACEPPPPLFVLEWLAQGAGDVLERVNNPGPGDRFPRARRENGNIVRREIESKGERPDQSSLTKGCVVRARLSRGNARVGRRGSSAAEAPPVAPHGKGQGVVLEAAKWTQTCFEVSLTTTDLKTK